jgi:hypothetical protein
MKRATPESTSMISSGSTSPSPAAPDDGPRTVHRPDPAAVRHGHLMVFTHYVNVEDISGDGAHLTVRDLDDNMQFEVNGLSLVARAGSADLYSEVQQVTRTRLAEILVECFGRVITIHWTKDDAKPRTLRGRYVSHEQLMGRSYVEDLELPHDEKNRLRLVSHRTLHWLIVDGVKYEVKK